MTTKKTIKNPSLSTASAARRQVWFITEYANANGEVKSLWTPMGISFRNKDGSENIRLNFMPGGDGYFQVRDFKDREEG
jgi:hypothetical protein